MKSTAVILAPHPDDECITGLLPLRLREECGFRIRVVPVTLGSLESRRAERRRELKAACRELDFHPWFPPANADGAATPGGLRSWLLEIRPDVVILPHARDGHPTHRRVHRISLAALDAARGVEWNVVETEYWHPLERPNLMVAADTAQLARLCRALACHAGENARNPYAERLPAWMIDNVRRGAELVGGPGAVAPDMAFATLYRARRRVNGTWTSAFRGTRIIESSEDLGALASRWRRAR